MVVFVFPSIPHPQENFVDMFPLYLTSHFNPAFELLVVLLVYSSFASTGYFLETFSVYLLVIGLLWTPLVFNPNGLDFQYARYVRVCCARALPCLFACFFVCAIILSSVSTC